MNPLKLISFTITAVVLQACAVDKSGQPFSFPSNQLAPAPAATGGGGSSRAIQILSSATFNSTSNSPVAVGNLVYDGTRLLVIDTSGGWPISGTTTFDYFSTSLVFQAHSTSTFTGNVNFTATSAGPVAGQTALYYNNSSPYLAVRDDSSGSVLSTTSINFSTYGCNGSTGAPLTFCNSLYYGACTTGGGFMRLFSFNAAGALQSAVTTTTSDPTADAQGLTCYDNNSLLLALNATFYKYDLNFNLLATDATSSASFPSGLQSPVGIATDGTNLYLQGALNNSANPPTFMLGIATLGILK